MRMILMGQFASIFPNSLVAAKYGTMGVGIKTQTRYSNLSLSVYTVIVFTTNYSSIFYKQ